MSFDRGVHRQSGDACGKVVTGPLLGEVTGASMSEVLPGASLGEVLTVAYPPTDCGPD